MVERYGRAPTPEQWREDPIVSRLKPEFAASIHDDVLRFATATWDLKTLPERLSEVEQVAFVREQLDRGLPQQPREPREALMVLATKRSAVVLPIIENKIEQVIKSHNPIDCFTDKTVRPTLFLALVSDMITQAGDEVALSQEAKLLKLRRIDELVFATFRAASTRGNPFTLAYRGIEMNDPDLNRVIAAWAEGILAEPMLNLPKDMRHQWFEAVVNRYGIVPDRSRWARDPIASRLRPALAESVFADLTRLASTPSEK